jgi:hypothetical protein
MWQTINLTNFADSPLIDTQVVKFNLSAWLGGYDIQDDNAMVSITFRNQTNHVLVNGITIGPVLPRSNDTGPYTAV